MGLFKNSSTRTNSKQKDNALKPVTLNMGADMSLKLVEEALKGFEFETLSPRPDYHEIYAAKEDCEFTFSFIEDFGKTHLSVLAFSEKHPLRMRKLLKSIMLYIREKMEGHIE